MKRVRKKQCWRRVTWQRRALKVECWAQCERVPTNQISLTSQFCQRPVPQFPKEK